MTYADLYSPTPQSQPLTPDQTPNNAGGFVFTLDLWKRLDRFLVLGSDAQTYYQNERDLTRENALVVIDCWATDPARTAAAIVAVSEAGRAPKNAPAIFALALGTISDNVEVRQTALKAMPKVCRTASHLFEFVATARKIGRGWGRAMKRAIAAWYAVKTTDDVAFQMVKYRERHGYTHKRLLESAHRGASADDPTRAALYRWARGKTVDADLDPMPRIVMAHALAMGGSRKLPELVTQFRLPWEALPTDALRDPDVWRAMLPHTGLTALIRKLGVLTELGVIGPMNHALVCERLTNAEAIRKSRVHPFAVLQALAVYRSGQGVKGSKTWTPVGPVVDALDAAFYSAFANAEPTGKRIMLALDVSGSMTSSMGGSPLTVREAAAALALVTAATEPNHMIVGFSAGAGHGWAAERQSYGYGRDGISPLPISPRQRLDDVVRVTSGLPFGRTDCALPMLYAQAAGLDVDAFVILTDNETYAGGVHPAQALRDYRRKRGIAAKLVVVGMTSTGFSIADPNDAGMLDVVGMDSSVPSLIADFLR